MNAHFTQSKSHTPYNDLQGSIQFPSTLTICISYDLLIVHSTPAPLSLHCSQACFCRQDLALMLPPPGILFIRYRKPLLFKSLHYTTSLLQKTYIGYLFSLIERNPKSDFRFCKKQHSVLILRRAIREVAHTPSSKSGQAPYPGTILSIQPPKL